MGTHYKNQAEDNEQFHKKTHGSGDRLCSLLITVINTVDSILHNEQSFQAEFGLLIFADTASLKRINLFNNSIVFPKTQEC